MRGGFVQAAAYDRRQFRVAMAGSWLGQCRLARDKGPDATTGLEHARSFEIYIHSGDRVGVDGQVYGELPDGGQLGSGQQHAGGYRGTDLMVQLHVQRRGVSCVNREQSPHES